MGCVRMMLVVLLLLVLQQGTFSTNEQKQHVCPPSSCGKISNISYPFRLKTDPFQCGDTRYELSCENNVTNLYLYLYSSKYHVQSINYNNFTIRLVDPGIQESNYSSIPLYSLSRFYFCDGSYQYDEKYCSDPYQAIGGAYDNLYFEHIVYLNCSHPVTNNKKYVDTVPFVNWKNNSKGYIYAMAGDLFAKDFQVGCHVKMVTPTSWSGLLQGNKSQISYDVIHKALVYGFEISWLNLPCYNLCGDLESCNFNISTEILQCYGFCFNFQGIGERTNVCGIWYQLGIYAKDTIIAIWIGFTEMIKGENSNYDYLEYRVGLFTGHYLIPSFVASRFLLGTTLFIALLIYKWRKRHLSMYEYIEIYLQQQNNMMPIRYSYKEIKNMARGFKVKLGEGGFGTVFKGNLRSGPSIAIKMLGKSKGNGQDFISEVSTIGRIHHLNVVQLIGFCAEGSKRALIYEFMPNGSLDKYIFSKEESIDISYDRIFEISVGVARGIAYLHHGCEMKILHFDIKPHNILLDENFTPKVSDFGLAKLHPLENSIVTMTAARGTIGYMAPELFYKNIGGVSYKADVYSFGMLLMEMASKRRNLNPRVEHSSQLYFPLWIYDQLGKEQDIEMEDTTEEKKKIVKKMIIVALWCIQLKPDDRPSMSKVLEMLEGDVENLEMPPKPILYPHETISHDQGTNFNQTMSSDWTSSYDLTKIESIPLVENIA